MSSHARALIACLVAILFALIGEAILRAQDVPAVPAATVFYALAVVTMVAGAMGSYRHRDLLAAAPAPAQGADDTQSVPAIRRERQFTSARPWVRGLRFVLTGVALLLAFLSMQVLRQDPMSGAGTWLFGAALLLLLLAWVGERAPAVGGEIALPQSQRDAEVTTDWKLGWRLETGYVLVIAAIALALRLYNLGYLVWGMHGDEGEAGSDAVNILHGAVVSPWTTGWFSFSNIYYYSVAASLKLFGMDLTGLRMWTVLFSMLAFPFFYLLLRRMFGVRAAFISLALLATNAIFLHYSRVHFNNIALPVLWIIGFYFLLRGLAQRRMIDFILAAYSSFFSLYFYMGARVLPFMMLGLFAYLALFKRPFLRRYFAHLLVFGVAAYVISAPYAGYYLDHSGEMNARNVEKLIYNNLQLMNDMYGQPPQLALPGGAEFAVPAPIYYFGRQFMRTFAMFTFRPTASSLYSFTGEPIINFLEAALFVLGLCWSAWRWRDPRFALLLIWFWASYFAGGVLTIDAPDSDRLAGSFPTFSIFIMLIINKVAAELCAVWPALSWPRWHLHLPLSKIAAALVALLVAGLCIQNVSDYFGRFVEKHWAADASAQAYFVEQNGAAYKYYEIGIPFALNFNHGDTRFIRLTKNIDGRDMLNPGSSLPLADNDGKDVLFIVSNGMAPQLRALQSIYPAGSAAPYLFDNSVSTFSSFSLTKAAISATQQVDVTYTPAGGDPVTLQSPSIGTAAVPPPAGSAYPLAARWSGGLVAPAFASYDFRLTVPDAATLLIDGRVVLRTGTAGVVEGQAILARGVHLFALDTSLPGPDGQVGLLWRAGYSLWQSPTGLELWNGAPGGLSAEIYPLREDAVRGGPALDLGAVGVQPLKRRVDSMIDWRSPREGFAMPGPFTARWRGEFIARQDGEYSFETLSNDSNGVWIDGRQVVLKSASSAPLESARGTIMLTAGAHQIELRYNSTQEQGALALYVTAPGHEREVANGTMFGPPNGVWLPGEIVAPVNDGAVLAVTAALPAPVRTLQLDGLSKPRALAVGPDNNLYVADTGNARIAVFAADGTLLRAWGTRGAGAVQFVEPGGLAFSPAEELYVSDRATGRVQVFNMAGQLMRTVAALSSPNGLSVAADGTLYVANTAASEALRIDPDGVRLALPGGAAASANRLDQPVDVLAAPAGGVYVADLKNRIMLLNRAGQVAQTWSLPVGRFQGTAKLALLDDKLFLTDPDTAQLAELDPTTGSGEQFDLSKLDKPLKQPTGIAAVAGELYVLDGASGLVQVFKFGD